MRILDRHGLMKLPSGTVYFLLNTCMEAGSLHIKLETIKGLSGEAIDWLYYDPCDIDARDSNERDMRLDEMLTTGIEFPINKSSARDGGFDDKERFLVCSEIDKKHLIDSLLGIDKESVKMGDIKPFQCGTGEMGTLYWTKDYDPEVDRIDFYFKGSDGEYIPWEPTEAQKQMLSVFGMPTRAYDTIPAVPPALPE